MADTAKAVSIINNALYYGQDNEWRLEGDGITQKKANTFKTLIRRNEFYKTLVMQIIADKARWTEEDYQDRVAIERTKQQMGLPNHLSIFND